MASAVCSSSKAASVAAWSIGSSATMARMASEERTSVGAKWRAAKVLLPAPLGPTSSTSASGGREMITRRRPSA